MTWVLLSVSPQTRQEITRLFADKPPVLVEVRFPGMGVASDWYLVEEEDELDSIWERIAAGVELYFQSVWDLRQSPGVVCVKK